MYAVAVHRGQQVERLADVVLVVEQRLRHRLRHDDRRRAVHDDVDGLVGEHSVHERRVGDVTLVRRTTLPDLPSTYREVVDDDDLMARVEAGGRDGAPDVAGPAGDEYAHGSTLASRLISGRCRARGAGRQRPTPYGR